MTRRRLLQSLLIAPFAGMFAKKAKTWVVNPAWKDAQYEVWVAAPPRYEYRVATAGYLQVIQDGAGEPVFWITTGGNPEETELVDA